MDKCSIEGCNNQGKLNKYGVRFYPRGFCNTHYKYFCRDNREVIDEAKKKCEKCSVEDCDNPPPYKKGLCNKHYTRMHKYGDVNFLQKRRDGQTTHPLYSSYHSMKSRCLNPEDKDYLKYGGRGITICDGWLGVDGFFNFIEDMGERPEGHTLDRKNNESGYCKENCRWATIHEQNSNKRNSNNTGIIFYKNSNKYRVRISVDGISYNLGWYFNIEDAISARKAGEIKYGVVC